jgi:glutamine cyclotransferase
LEEISRASSGDLSWNGLLAGVVVALFWSLMMLSWPSMGLAAPFLNYRIAAVHAHDPQCFTQGLQFRDGLVYQSSGLYGRSYLRVWELATGRALRETPLDRRLFAEGLALAGNEIVLLTWREGMALRFDMRSLAPRGSFAYRNQGWGLAFDGKRLIQSDGSAFLILRHPDTFVPLGRLQVTDQGQPVRLLNELEWIPPEPKAGVLAGMLLANVWLAERIAVIDPANGQVRGWLDLTPLTTEAGGGKPDAVANGIAYDSSTGRLLVTGKLWAFLYELELR